MFNVFGASLPPSPHHHTPAPASLLITHASPATMTFVSTLYYFLHSCLKKFNFALYIFVLLDVSNKRVWKDLLPAPPLPPPPRHILSGLLWYL